MSVILPHANGYQIEESLFTQAWNWLQHSFGHKEIHPNHLPVLQSRCPFSELHDSGAQLSLEYLCRILVPASYRNTAQASNEFFELNRHIVDITPEDIFNPRSGRMVKGAELTTAHAIVSLDIEKIFESALDEPGTPATVAPHPAPKTTHMPPPVANSPVDPIRAFVELIACDPYQAMYRRRPISGKGPVYGWDARLDAYFWPRPGIDRHKTNDALVPLVDRLGPLVKAVVAGTPWCSDEQDAARDCAKDIFSWGRVPQDPATVTWKNVQAVIRASVDDDKHATAPMNSGWTKVAAIATAGTSNEQVIWDSRVATSIVRRLDTILVSAGYSELPDAFLHLGIVPGQGGTRPLRAEELQLAWGSGYANWRSQVAASVFVRKLRDLLNERGSSWSRRTGYWTVRDVEMVLFMDGY